MSSTTAKTSRRSLRVWIPGQPRPKARPRFRREGNLTYTDTLTRSEEDKLAILIKQQAAKDYPELPPTKLFGGDVHLELHFYRTGQRRADLDNLVKLVKDAINRSGVWEDDRQVVSLDASMTHGSDTPGTHVGIKAR